MKHRRQFSLLLILCLLAALVSGCGSSGVKSESADYAMGSPAMGGDRNSFEMAVEETAAYEDGKITADTGASDSGAALPSSRKFVITVNMSVETEDLETLMNNLLTKVSDLSGYVENQYVYNGSNYSNRRYRNASLVLRIPAASLDAFTQDLGSDANVISTTRNTEDVTLRYVDTESRVLALQTEQTRLIELLSQAANTTELLEIESRLTEVRYELEQYSSRLRVLDNQIDYATVNLDLTEVREFTPVEEKTRWETIRDGFLGSLRNLGEGILDFFTWILVEIPYFLFLAAALWLAVVLIRFTAKKRSAAKAKKLAARYQQAQSQQQNPEKKE